MNPEERLAAIVAALESAGFRCLILGGHAVRYYGFERNTIDFDLHLASDRWNDLSAILANVPLFSSGVTEGNSWRPEDFRRFQIGRLPDGREEWLEFWRHNHLLGPFEEMYFRRESGVYGGEMLNFVSLPDLIRSKETERTHDWQDIEILEQILDSRHLATAKTGGNSVVDALCTLRSRSGLEAFLQAGLLGDPGAIAAAFSRIDQCVTQALLLPFSPEVKLRPTNPAIEPIVEQRLRETAPASGLHLTLVEAVRRRYRACRQDEDRKDKDRIRKPT